MFISVCVCVQVAWVHVTLGVSGSKSPREQKLPEEDGRGSEEAPGVYLGGQGREVEELEGPEENESMQF